jgi:aldose 1-epimerase
MLLACQEDEMAATVSAESFGRIPGGREATLHTLRTAQLRVCITDFGGRIVSICTADREQRAGEVLLGFDEAAGYASAGGAFGALLGRTANRIAHGSFEINGRRFELGRNDRHSNLHGGPVGFDMVMWRTAAVKPGPTPTLVLSHVSPAGDQGFPGELSVQVTYRLEGCSLWLTFEAHTTEPTPVSLSAHPYFNLSGPESASVLDHIVTIDSQQFLPTDAEQIPTGEVRSVAGTPFDFRCGTALAARIRQADPQLVHGLGYDHYFLLPKSGSAGPCRLAARAVDPSSGRTLEVLTTQPGLQLYTGNKLDGRVVGRGGAYRQSAGLAFEPQGFPDASHHPGFPTNILAPNEPYFEIIGYRFGIHD